ncbi:MAG TPA: hypothetical protein VGR31_14845 [Planctomycetota bacterium]|jgi:hypothetical protein|nr:hypothetical protein [Planctomycetota bacterium]
MSDLLRGPAYRIETDRLVLRCFDPNDAVLLKSAVDASLGDVPRSRVLGQGCLTC